MRKAFKLDGLCCANCAQKIEDDINKLDEVNSARVVFMTEKLILDVADGTLPTVLERAQEICNLYEEDCTILV